MAPDCLRKSLDYLRAHPECGVLGAVDHCHAVKAAGWKVVCHPESGGGAQVQQLQVESELLFIRKHDGRSGLFLHLCLTTLEVGLQAVKALIRRRKSELLESRWKHLTLAASLARQTSFGTRPTR